MVNYTLPLLLVFTVVVDSGGGDGDDGSHNTGIAGLTLCV